MVFPTESVGLRFEYERGEMVSTGKRGKNEEKPVIATKPLSNIMFACNLEYRKLQVVLRGQK